MSGYPFTSVLVLALALMWTIGWAPGLRHLSGAAGLTIIECIVVLCLCVSQYIMRVQFANKDLWCRRIADGCSVAQYYAFGCIDRIG